MADGKISSLREVFRATSPLISVDAPGIQRRLVADAPMYFDFLPCFI
jgi:hypothetical protein